MGSNGNDHDHIQCGCHNPIWEALKHSLNPAGHLTGQPANAHGPGLETGGESIVFTHGHIYPLRNGNMDERVEALGIHAGDVVASGTLADVESRLRALGIAYRVQSLEGRTLLPGLVEPHAHIVQSCAMEDWIPVGAFDQERQRLRETYDWNWLVETLRSAPVKDPSSWILGRMVDPALMPFKKVEGGLNQLITLGCGFDEEIGNLDSIDAERPILLISASMHTAYMNSAASEAVFRKTGVKANKGLLQEREILHAIRSIPVQQQLQMLKIFKHLKDYFNTATQRGITLLYDAMMDPISRLVLDAYFLTHPRNLRIGYAAACDGSAKSLQSLPPYRPATREEAKRIYQGSVKLVSDGSNQGLTGYQSVDYCCETTPRRGNFNVCDEQQPEPQTLPVAYQTLVSKAVETGWPLMIHANGDRAIDFTLQAYAGAFKDGNGLEKRHRIEHCSLLNADSLERMKQLGLSPSFLIGHVGYWGYSFQQAIFEQRAETMLDLCKSALKHNLRISLHSDCTVTPLGPLRSMEQAVTRKMEGIRSTQSPYPVLQNPEDYPVLNAGECLSRQEALKAITYDAAWQCHAERWMGSLQDNNFADLVILEQDPLDENIPATGIRDIQVYQTWKGGQRVYQR
ncbi:amidohydrolase [Pseudomonas protegens]|uniref:amidohydrolase n=1 Tax=Pseudomonas protegens TaxID=380021 RepID=UPI000E1E7768|nr:amidohydrolase family protein [Pseudomonas protegens]AXK52905.1 amidohydrolase [Pseudomonas protegens]